MAYIGTSPTQGVRRIYNYTATASQTSFSGNDTLGISLAYADGAYIDVYQNGVLLIPTDYVATTGTTVVLDTAAAVNDTVQMVVYDVFSVGDSVSQSAGGNFAGDVGMGGTLAVTGNTTVGGTLGVTGAVTLSTKLATTNLATGAVVQVVNVQDGAVANTTANIANDDSIPQKTEGGEFMTLAITPTNSNNKLLIEVAFFCSPQGASAICVALFQDTTAGALAVSGHLMEQGEGTVCINFNHFMTAGTTSATTFKVRAGGHTGYLTFNGNGQTTRQFGGRLASSITITEIAV